MKAGALLFSNIIILFSGCHFADEKPKTISKNKVRDTIVVHKKIIRKELLQPQSRPYDGQYCLIKNEYTQNGTHYIEADYIQFLMGKEAIKAAQKRGEAEMVMDDYYILNENTKIRKLALAKDVVIQLVTSENGQSFFVDGDEAMFRQNIKQGGIFVVAIENGTVQKIKEQFLP